MPLVCHNIDVLSMQEYFVFCFTILHLSVTSHLSFPQLTAYYIVDKSSRWAAAIAAFFVTGYFIILAMLVHSVQKDPHYSFLSNPSIKAAIGLIFFAVSVTTITVVLYRKLSSVQTCFKRTERILQQLQLYTITRGLLVTVNSVVLLIVYIAQSSTLHWFPFFLFASRFHIISIVAMLNARTHPANQLDEGMISIPNIETVFDQFKRNPVADGSNIEPHIMHLNNLPDAQDGKHGNMLKIHE
ncbi:hypothetical protein L208DRAFT_490634 [Tricholoma matsutake]|nr:hypothetical protein L208DRAFT_490634 [Tricholoma matsutake 945]